jgi:hypothetical protein
MRWWIGLLVLYACACSDGNVQHVDDSSDDGAHAGGDAAVQDASSNGVREPKIHRAKPMTCDHARGPSAPSDLAIPCEDAICTDGQNGRCEPHGNRVAICTYDECFADDDCPHGACACADSDTGNNRCFDGDCMTDADCGPGGYCSPSRQPCETLTDPSALYCHTEQDECIDDSDCVDGNCAYAPTVRHWQCKSRFCLN